MGIMISVHPDRYRALNNRVGSADLCPGIEVNAGKSSDTTGGNLTNYHFAICTHWQLFETLLTALLNELTRIAG